MQAPNYWCPKNPKREFFHHYFLLEELNLKTVELCEVIVTDEKNNLYFSPSSRNRKFCNALYLLKIGGITS